MNRYTISEAASELRMSEAWVRKQVFEKKIRVIRIGRRVFVPRSTLVDILKKGIQEPRV